MTGSTLQVPPAAGNWTVVFDSGIAGAEWGNITWSASTCGNGAVTVTAATSTNGTTFTLPQPVTPGAELTIADGRYLRVTVKLERAKGGFTPILYDLSVGTVGYPLLPATPPNAAPSVNAGADQTVILPRKGSLVGAACDDGRPSPLNVSWQQVSGTGTTTFTPGNTPATTAAFSAPGTYVLRLTASDGELTSSDDVTVIAATPACIATAPDIRAWWPLDGNANDVINGRRATITGASTFESGMVGQGFVFTGANHITAAASTELNVTESFTVDAWVFPTTPSAERPLVEWGQPGVIGVHIWESFQLNVGMSPGALYANIVDTAGGSHTLGTGPGALMPNQWSHIALTFDKATGRARLYINGQVVASNLLGTNFTPRTNVPLNFGFRPAQGQRFIGRLDEIDLLARALSEAEVQDIYLAGALGKCKTPNDRPIVDAGPDQTLLLPAASATLTGTTTDDGRPPGGLTATWAQVSGPAPVVFGTPTSLQTTATFGPAGVYVLRLTVSDLELSGTDEITVTVYERSDLTVRSVNASGVITNRQTLQVSGTATAEIVNIGGGPTLGSFEVTFFEDRNGNASYDEGTDVEVGTGLHDALAAGDVAVVSADLSGTVLFAGNLVYAFADSGRAIPEGNETNNYGSSAPPCEAAPPGGGPFAPRLEWAWSGSPIQSTSNQVMMTPAVADLNADGTPDVIFSTFSGGNYFSAGFLRAVSGGDGSALFTGTGRRLPCERRRIDRCWRYRRRRPARDRRRRRVGRQNDRLRARRHVQVAQPAVPGGLGWGGPALADLDRDGAPEIVSGATVLAADGTLRWSGSAGRGDNASVRSRWWRTSTGGASEVVAGNTAYRADGTVYWRNTALGDGFNAVGNFDADPHPEIVLVANGGVLPEQPRRLQGLGSGGPARRRARRRPGGGRPGRRRPAGDRRRRRGPLRRPGQERRDQVGGGHAGQRLARHRLRRLRLRGGRRGRSWS